VYHSMLGLRVIQKKNKVGVVPRDFAVTILVIHVAGEDGDVVRSPHQQRVSRIPVGGNSTSHGARPVHLIITMIKWIRASRLSINNSLSREDGDVVRGSHQQRAPRIPLGIGSWF